jgi:hypothetical protein
MTTTWALIISFFFITGDTMVMEPGTYQTETMCIEAGKAPVPLLVKLGLLGDGERIEIRCIPVTGDPIVDGINRVVVEGQSPAAIFGPKGE